MSLALFRLAGTRKDDKELNAKGSKIWSYGDSGSATGRCRLQQHGQSCKVVGTGPLSHMDAHGTGAHALPCLLSRHAYIESPEFCCTSACMSRRSVPQHSNECKVCSGTKLLAGHGNKTTLGLSLPPAKIHVLHQHHLLATHRVLGGTKERCNGSVDHLLEKTTGHFVLQSFASLFEVGIGIHL